MENKNQYLNLFNHGHLLPLKTKLITLVESAEPPPTEELLKILEKSTDMELTGLILEILFLNQKSNFITLREAFKTTDSEMVKFYISLILSLIPDFKSMTFLIQIYLKHDWLRPSIRKMGFKDKTKLLLALGKAIDELEITDEDEYIIKELLKTVPRSAWNETGGILANHYVHDLYLSIPPKERHKPKNA